MPETCELARVGISCFVFGHSPSPIPSLSAHNVVRHGEWWQPWSGAKYEVVDESEALSLAIQGIYADVDAEPGGSAAALAAHEACGWQLEPAGPAPHPVGTSARDMSFIDSADFEDSCSEQSPHGDAWARDLNSIDSADFNDSWSEQSFESEPAAVGAVPEASVRAADCRLARMRYI